LAPAGHDAGHDAGQHAGHWQWPMREVAH